MSRPRKIHIQQSLPLEKKWGGKRDGAGRPRKGYRASEPHKVRPTLDPRHPLHITLRVERAVGNLRRRDAYHAVRRAMSQTLGRDDFRIVHISLESDHIHLVVEAEHRLALARGLQGFEISAARHLNRAISKATGTRRRGCVFVDRYYAVPLRSPSQVRNAVRYVLNNWRRHREDQGIDTMFWDVDYFSSGVSFSGWQELAGAAFLPPAPPGYEHLGVASPRTWLLAEGWTRAGTISMHSVPGPLERARSLGARGASGSRLPACCAAARRPAERRRGRL